MPGSFEVSCMPISGGLSNMAFRVMMSAGGAPAAGSHVDAYDEAGDGHGGAGDDLADDDDYHVCRRAG